jgi:hypothetical protein
MTYIAVATIRLALVCSVAIVANITGIVQCALVAVITRIRSVTPIGAAGISQALVRATCPAGIDITGVHIARIYAAVA